MLGQPVLFMGSFPLQCTCVGCVLCVPLSIRGECRLQTLQYPFLDGSRVEMQPGIEYDQTLRGSACPHVRALLINLKDSSKQANELFPEPHRASFVDVSKGCVRDLPDQITVVASLAPRQIDKSTEGMLSGLARDDRSREVPKLVLWGKKSRVILSRTRSIPH